MKKHFIYTIISAMVIWGVCGPAAALSSEDNQTFLDMINKIREDPYTYAVDELEYDSESLIANGIGPDTKLDLDPYTLDENLTAMAADESELMAGGEILETTKPVHRLTASTGGVVSFFNFMSQDTAFKVVIDYLFRNELDTNEFNHILSNKYAYAGIAISAGTVESGNAWFVAINLGSSALVSEIQMLNLINQLRSNPKNIWEYTELNHINAHELNSNIENLTSSGNKYKPLFFNASLSASAQEAHSFYMPEEPEPQTPLERAIDYGYEGEAVEEYFLPVLPSTEEEDALSVDSLFLSLIQQELEKWPQSPVPVVFLKDFQDVGSNISQPGEDIEDPLLSFVVGKNTLTNTSNDENTSSNSDELSRIYGILFEDKNGNDRYDPGEEIIQQTVKVYVDDEMQEPHKTAVTDNAGHFFMELEANHQYDFIATLEENVPVIWKGYVEDQNGWWYEDKNENTTKIITSDQFVNLCYTPPSLENDPLEADLE